MHATTFPITITAPPISAAEYIVIIIATLIIMRGPVWIAELRELYKAQTERKMIESGEESTESITLSSAEEEKAAASARAQQELTRLHNKREKLPPDKPT